MRYNKYISAIYIKISTMIHRNAKVLNCKLGAKIIKYISRYDWAEIFSVFCCTILYIR